MKVVALKVGFFAGSLVPQGTEFDVPAGFKASWVAPIESAASEAAKPKPAAKAVPRALSELKNEASKSFTQVMAPQPDLA